MSYAHPVGLAKVGRRARPAAGGGPSGRRPGRTRSIVPYCIKWVICVPWLILTKEFSMRAIRHIRLCLRARRIWPFKKKRELLCSDTKNNSRTLRSCLPRQTLLLPINAHTGSMVSQFSHHLLSLPPDAAAAHGGVGPASGGDDGPHLVEEASPPRWESH